MAGKGKQEETVLLPAWCMPKPDLGAERFYLKTTQSGDDEFQKN